MPNLVTKLPLTKLLPEMSYARWTPKSKNEGTYFAFCNIWPPIEKLAVASVSVASIAT